VVAGETSGTRELVLHQQTGILVPIGERTELARQSHQLLDDAALCKRLGQAAQERIRLDFHPDKMISKHIEMYRQILG
jgi:glycosyltransferase involved in cell wall biosynthesis